VILLAEVKKVLIVEDDSSIIRVLEIILKSENFEVYSTSYGEEVTSLLTDLKPDLFILDIGLPDMSGIDIIDIIRNKTQSPIIMLSGKNTDVEKITSLKLGADDYVVKPFSAAELLARIDAVFRRFNHQSKYIHNAQDDFSESDIIKIDVEKQLVLVNKQEVVLTNKEFKLLHLLHSKRGRVLTREFILDNIWGIDNCSIETRAVDACASRLRKKIRGALGQDIIMGVPGSGYRLIELQ
jgi:DNA-binding response OmpR family regulator